ncbi:MAG: thioredoxin family protein [Myxococcaceae bacterium]|nr:thioredoxin family protein [Myxococcaceae bacterium]
MRVACLSLLLLSCTKVSPPTADPAATVRFITPPMAGEVSSIMSAQLAKSKAEGRQVLLYCGATWCEPCRYFHEAVDRGELTGKVGALDLVAFDSQVDAERMLLSGYESQFIPLFAAVGPDGKATGRKIEGSVKGPGAVDELVPRLKALLAEAPR